MVSFETHVSLAFLHWEVPGYTLKYLNWNQNNFFFFFCIEDNAVIHTKLHKRFQYECQKRTFQCQRSAIILHVLHAAVIKSSLFITAKKKKWQLRWCAQIFGCRGLLDLVTVTHFLCARGETLISCSTQEISAHTIHLWPLFSSSTDTKCENQVSVVKAPPFAPPGEKKKKCNDGRKSEKTWPEKQKL